MKKVEILDVDKDQEFENLMEDYRDKLQLLDEEQRSLIRKKMDYYLQVHALSENHQDESIEAVLQEYRAAIMMNTMTAIDMFIHTNTLRSLNVF